MNQKENGWVKKNSSVKIYRSYVKKLRQELGDKMVEVKCKPFHLRKRGDFGYCTAVDTFIGKANSDLKFYDEKMNEAISIGDSCTEDVFRKAIERTNKELRSLKTEKDFCDSLPKRRR